MNRLHCPDCGIPTIPDTDAFGLDDDEKRCGRCYNLSVFKRIQARIDNCEEDTLQKITQDIQEAIEKHIS